MKNSIAISTVLLFSLVAYHKTHVLAAVLGFKFQFKKMMERSQLVHHKSFLMANSNSKPPSLARPFLARPFRPLLSTQLSYPDARLLKNLLKPLVNGIKRYNGTLPCGLPIIKGSLFWPEQRLSQSFSYLKNPLLMQLFYLRVGHLILRALAIRASDPQNALARTSFHSPKSLPPTPVSF